MCAVSFFTNWQICLCNRNTHLQPQCVWCNGSNPRKEKYHDHDYELVVDGFFVETVLAEATSFR